MDKKSKTDRLLYWAKERAKRSNIPFTLKKSDIRIPKRCPVLGIKLRGGAGKSADHSPTLDRIVPSKGYTRSNVIVVSYLANSIRRNGTIKQIRRVYEFYAKLLEGRSSRAVSPRSRGRVHPG